MSVKIQFVAQMQPAKGVSEIQFVAQRESGAKTSAPSWIYSNAELADLFPKGAANSFQGKSGQVAFFPQFDRKNKTHLLVGGLGSTKEFNEVFGLDIFRKLGANLVQKINAEKISSVQIDLGFFSDLGAETTARRYEAFFEGITLGNYSIEKALAKASSPTPLKIFLIAKDKVELEKIKDAASDALDVGECVELTRRWSNHPSNIGTPAFYASEAVKLARTHGIKAKVLSRKDCEKEGMGLFLSVGTGCSRESKLVVLEYKPKKFNKTVALVGKGVTFDSGGISIKPSMRMEDMKHDMTGAATLFSALLLLARRKAPVHVVTVLGFTENMPSGLATQPGNVFKTRNGKTVEVINTDAEGRLVLADALDYAQDFKPDLIIDAATLTGAALVALGKICTAVLTNREELGNRFRKVADALGEKSWQLPLYPEYLEDLKSDYADLKNSANDGYGGTIRGGIFLKEFIKNDTPWIHLDIAGVAYDVRHLAYCPKRGGTGLNVRSVARFVEEYV